MDYKKLNKEYLEEIKKEVEEAIQYQETKTKNILSKKVDRLQKINGVWAFDLFDEERWGEEHKGSKISGHLSSMYLVSSNGTWYDQEGNIIKGYLYWKEKN